MAEFTGNIHSLELALPFPAPASNAVTVFAVGRTFGDAGSDGLDVWVSDTVTTSYNPPDGPPLQIKVGTLIACVHGWLRFVANGQAVPNLLTRTGDPLIVSSDTLVLSTWPTLRANLERMSEHGSFLLPQSEQGRGGRPSLEHLLYENVDLSTLDAAIEKLIKESRPDPYFSATDRAAMVASFRQGEIRILARAGRVLGQAATSSDSYPSGASPSWLKITLRAVDRLGQLFDAGYFLRRLQELSEVLDIPVLVDKSLIPTRAAVRDHPLPKLTPRRFVVDWRDELGVPVPGARFVLSTDTLTDTKVADSQGIWLGETLPDGADPLSISNNVLAAESPDVKLGTLPNAPRSYDALDRDVIADDYLIVSALNVAKWFPDRPSASPPVEPLRRYSDGNRVTSLVDARRAFWMIYRALRRTFNDTDFENLAEGSNPPEGPALSPAIRAGNRIYMTNWKLAPDLWMPDSTQGFSPAPYDENGQGPFDRRGHLMGLLRAAIANDIEVRALLWRQLVTEPDFKSDNTAAVKGINREEGGKRGFAVLDDICRTTGSHHMKALVIQNADGRLAFLGGIDLGLGKFDTPEHIPDDQRAEGDRISGSVVHSDGWHDIHCMVEGPAVDDVEDNFRHRWNQNPVVVATLTPAPSRPPSERLDPIPQASHYVQINRTIPPGLPHYHFVDQSTGDHSAWKARVNAIRNAERYIYIEDQYLTMCKPADYAALRASADPLNFVVTDEDTIAAALRSRLVGPNKIESVAILIPKLLQEDPAFGNMVLYELRRRFIDFITLGLSDEEKRERLLVFHLRNRTGSPTYVHAKTMVVDDLWASIGSSNVGYRSMTYDSEINCDVLDGAIDHGARPYARDLRISLWAEHLRLGREGAYRVKDPRKGFELLRAAAEGNQAEPHHVDPYDPEYVGVDLTLPGAPPPYDPANPQHELVRAHLIEPDGRNPDDPLLDYSALLALVQQL